MKPGLLRFSMYIYNRDDAVWEGSSMFAIKFACCHVTAAATAAVVGELS